MRDMFKEGELAMELVVKGILTTARVARLTGSRHSHENDFEKAVKKLKS